MYAQSFFQKPGFGKPFSTALTLTLPIRHPNLPRVCHDPFCPDVQPCGESPGSHPLRGEAVNDARAGLPMTRILLVEDFSAYRVFVSSLLMLRPDVRVIGEVTNGLDAVARAQELNPEVILLDIGLPGINGIEAARRILKLMPESKIVFLTQENSGEIMVEALSVGAYGYVIKSRAGTDLLPALDAALQGDQFVSGT